MSGPFVLSVSVRGVPPKTAVSPVVALGPTCGVPRVRSWFCLLYAYNQNFPVLPRLASWKGVCTVACAIFSAVAGADQAPSTSKESPKPTQIDLAKLTAVLIAIKSANVRSIWFESPCMTFLLASWVSRETRNPRHTTLQAEICIGRILLLAPGTLHGGLPADSVRHGQTSHKSVALRRQGVKDR